MRVLSIVPGAVVLLHPDESSVRHSNIAMIKIHEPSRRSSVERILGGEKWGRTGGQRRSGPDGGRTKHASEREERELHLSERWRGWSGAKRADPGKRRSGFEGRFPARRPGPGDNEPGSSETMWVGVGRRKRESSSSATERRSLS